MISEPIVSKKPFGPYKAPSPFGYPAGIQAAGTLAAPILAGFTVTMISIILPSIGDPTKPPFTRWPELTLLLLIAAALCLLMAVQASVIARIWETTPTMYREWWPNDFSLGEPSRPSHRVINHQRQALRNNYLWSKFMRVFCHLGIVALLATITVATVSPTRMSISRWAVTGLAALGALGEAAWIIVGNRPFRWIPSDDEVVEGPETTSSASPAP